MTNLAPHLNVEFCVVPSSEGGRATPIFHGYKPQFHLKGEDQIADTELHLPCGKIELGDSGTGQIGFCRPEAHLPKISVGDYFELREGARVVARGKIVSFIDDQVE
ncbi:MAG: hypothetical protein AAGE65_09190 [Planctomycetota bacterium]